MINRNMDELTLSHDPLEARIHGFSQSTGTLFGATFQAFDRRSEHVVSGVFASLVDVCISHLHFMNFSWISMVHSVVEGPRHCIEYQNNGKSGQVKSSQLSYLHSQTITTILLPPISDQVTSHSSAIFTEH